MTAQDHSSQDAASQKLPHGVTAVAVLYHPNTWKERGLWWTLGLFGLTYALVVGVLGLLWSRSPDNFDPQKIAEQMAKDRKGKIVPGYVTTATALQISETLLDKQGGYLTNDKTPPGVYLDDIPNWEFGVLTELRDLARALRNDFSRSQTQSPEDKDLQAAEPRFNYDSDSWILPSTESEYRAGIKALYSYLDRMADDKALDGQFFTRADNLAAYLGVSAKRLGDFAQQLAASVGQLRHNTDLAGDAQAKKSTPTPQQVEVKTSWWKTDDVFYEARGYSWALLHTLKAIEIDFRDVLQKKNATVSLQQIIRELEQTQATVWSPMILNGTGFGLVTNHSLIMASYISRANAAIIDLRQLLSQG